MSTQAGRAFVSVEYDPGSVRSLGSTTARESKRYESTWLQSAKRVALGIGFYFGGITAAKQLFVEPIKQAGDFQETLNVLKATVGATTGQMKAASAEAIRLGASTKLPAVTASDAAVAMTELGKAGFTAKQAMEAARGVLLLTTAAQTDEATAAQIAANAINVFGLKASKATHVANLLAGAANASSADITDLAEGLQYAGTGAAHAHQSIENIITALAEMATAGQSGSVAGSALSQMFRSLQSPTAKAKDELHKYSLEVFNSKGAMLPLPTLVQEFSDKLGGLSDKQKSAALNTIFGARAIRAAQIVLIGGTKSYDGFRKGVERANAAQQLATAHTKGFNGAVQALQSSFQTLQLELGLKVLPALTPVVEGLSKIISAPNLHVAVRVAFQGIKAGAADLGGALHDELFGSTKTTTIKAPTGFVLGRQQTQTQGIVQSVQKSINWTSIGKSVGSAIGSSITFTNDTVDNMVASLIAAVNDNRGAIAKAGLLIGVDMFADLIDPSFWISNWKVTLPAVISGLALAFGPESRLALFLKKIPIVGYLFKGLEAGGGLILDALRPLGRGILAGLRDVFPEATRAGELLAGRIVDSLRGLPGRVGGVIEDAGRFIGRELGNTARAASGEAARIGGRIVDALDGFIGRVGAAATRMSSRFLAPIEDLAGRVLGPVARVGRNIVNAVGGFTHSVWEAGYNIGRGILNGIISGADSLAGSLVSKLKGIVSGALGKVKSIFGIHSPSRVFADEVGRPIAQGIALGIDEHAHKVDRAVQGAIRGSMNGRGGTGRGAMLTITIPIDLGDGIRQVVTTQVDLATMMLGRA